MPIEYRHVTRLLAERSEQVGVGLWRGRKDDGFAEEGPDAGALLDAPRDELDGHLEVVVVVGAGVAAADVQGFKGTALQQQLCLLPLLLPESDESVEHALEDQGLEVALEEKWVLVGIDQRAQLGQPIQALLNALGLWRVVDPGGNMGH